MDCFSLYLQSVLKCFWSNIHTLMDVSESSLELLSLRSKCKTSHAVCLIVLHTLHGEYSTALQVSNHSHVLSCIAAVQILQDQFVCFPLRQNLALLTWLQLQTFKHPPNRDVVMWEAHLKGGCAIQQRRRIFYLLHNFDFCRKKVADKPLMWYDDTWQHCAQFLVMLIKSDTYSLRWVWHWQKVFQVWRSKQTRPVCCSPWPSAFGPCHWRRSRTFRCFAVPPRS